MADPLSLAVTIVTLVTKALTINKEIHSAVEQISKAPKHIKNLTDDLEDFYYILGCLKGYLEDTEVSTEVLQAAEKINIASVIENLYKSSQRLIS
jgi:Fungal N-terminal domain of STAND proteins